MATPNAYSVQLAASLLEDTTTVLTPGPSSASTGSITEGFGGLPQRIAGLASDVNVKLGTLTAPVFLAIWGSAGVSVKIAEGGTAIGADPFAFIANADAGLGISEVWLSNSNAAEATVTILAAEA